MKLFLNFSLPLIQEGKLSVSYWRKYTERNKFSIFSNAGCDFFLWEKYSKAVDRM